jgi:plastocyanin
MSKSAVIGIVIAVVVLGGGALLLFAPSNKNNSSINSASSNAATTNFVTIQNFAFSPSVIKIEKGTTVTWTNKDSTAHTVTETDGKNGPKSADIAPGKTFVFTFDTTGTYSYRCSIHSNMTGTVVVTN